MRCDDYVAAQDEETTLTMGNLTITRIRFCFAYLKSIIKKGGTGESTSSSSSAAPPAQGMERELQTLQSLVQQRDSEIAILVNMVKQGKQASSKAFSLPPAAAGLLKQGRGDNNGSNNSSNIRSLVVPRPKDLGLLQDANESFQYFRERWPGHEAIEENKKVLKEKYAEAKRMGEKVNQVILVAVDIRRRQSTYIGWCVRVNIFTTLVSYG